MKSLKVFLALSFALVFTLGFGTNFVEASGDSVSSEKGFEMPPPYEKPEKIVYNDGENEGQNNSEEVSVTVKKISDKPIPMPSGEGEWDYLGHDRFTHYSINFHSGGGNMKFHLSQSTATSQYQTYAVREYDETNSDETLFTFSLPGSTGTWEIIISGVSNFVDGDNGKAEIYLEKTNYIDQIYAEVDVWD